MTAIKLLRTMPSERIFNKSLSSKVSIPNLVRHGQEYGLHRNVRQTCLTTFSHIFVIFIEKLEIVCHTLVYHFWQNLKKCLATSHLIWKTLV